MELPSALGIKKVFSIEFVVDYFDRSRDFYLNKMGFAETHQSTRDWEDKFKSKAIYFSANDIKIMVSSPADHAQLYRPIFENIMSGNS